MEGWNDWLLYSYPTAEPFVDVRCVTEFLKKKHYVVVSDQENPCYGILTSDDLLEHPHKLVIDCMSKKENVQMEDSFDVMREKFKQSSSEALPVYSEDLFIGVLEKTNILIKCKNEIDEINKRKKGHSEFKESLLHNLYHEIRTPLSHVLGFMNVLSEMEHKDLKDTTKYQHIVKNGSRQFLQFMNELIDLSILESGEIVNINPSEFYPEDLFIDLKAQFESNMDVKTKTTIRYVKPIPNRMIVSDYKRLKQILYHLLNLAIYHPNVASSILIGCENFPDQEHIRFYIKNETATVNDVQGQIIKNSCQEGKENDAYKFGWSLEFTKKMIKLIRGSFDLEIDDQRKVCAYVTVPIMLTTSEFC